MKIKDIVSFLNKQVPLSLQEDFDNSGLNLGNYDHDVKGVLICLDVTLDVINEAINDNCNLIISHHPLIFSKLKRITSSNDIEKAIVLAIKNDISIFCGHTNFDNYHNGVSYKIAKKLNLKNISVLSPSLNTLEKISVFVPNDFVDIVREKMFEAGAGNIGNYDSCSFNSQGLGTFRANENANPFVGEKSKLHFENETKVEMVLQKSNEKAIVSAMLSVHPYEEVAYNIITLNNNSQTGLGIYGELEEEISEEQFLTLLKDIFFVKYIRHSQLRDKKIKKISLCGGSGAFLINNAIALSSDAFITGDLKYHDFFLAENKILLCDIGHYESEQFTKEIFYEIISSLNPDFPIKISKINTNPIYFY